MRRPQLSLRTLLLVVALLGAMLGAFCWQRDRARQQALAVKTIESILSIDVDYDFNLERSEDGSWNSRHVSERHYRGERWYVKPVGVDFWYSAVGIGEHPHPGYWGGNASEEEALYGAMARLSHLRVLWQYPAHFEGRHLRALTCQNSLEELHWRGNCFDTECLRELARFRNLRVLDFDIDTPSTSDQLPIDDWTPLAKLQKLREFSGRNTGIDDAGVVALSQIPTLTRLNLNNNQKIGERGAAAIASLTNLRELSMEETRITSAGANEWDRLKALRSLRLSSNSLDDTTLERLSALPRLQSLDIDNNRGPILGTGFESPEAFPALESLSIDSARLTAAAWRGLARLPKLRELSLTLDRTRPVEPDEQPMEFDPAGFASLRELYLYGPSLSAAAWSDVLQIRTLQELRTYDGQALVQAVRRHGGHPTLLRITVEGGRFSPDDQAELMRAMPQLKEIKTYHINQGPN